MLRHSKKPGFMLPGCLLALCLWSCASRERYAGTYINWESPVFLESGKIGLFQVAWDEYLTGCGYPLSGDNCRTTRNYRVHFISFSPTDGSLDTLFTPLPARYGESGSGDLSASYHSPYIHYGSNFSYGLYNLVSGEHRTFPAGIGAAFSRTGAFVTSEFQRVAVATGQAEALTPFPWQIDYYDDVAGKALVFRWSYTPDGPKNQPRVTPVSGVVYDVGSGTLDSSRATIFHIELTKRLRGSLVVANPVEIDSVTLKIPFARVDSFDLSAPSFDTAVVTTHGYYLDLDPGERVYVYENDSFRDREAGITVGTFDGRETAYRARDFHPGFPPAPRD